MCDWCKDYQDANWSIAYDPEFEAEQQLREEGKWKWDKAKQDIDEWIEEHDVSDESIFGPMYEDIMKEGWFKRWFKKVTRT